MRKYTRFSLAILLICVVITSAFGQAAKKPVTIELWYGAAITEAGPPPDDWVFYKIAREQLGIDLKLMALPSNENDQDVKILAAAAANQLPDLFMVRRDPWQVLIKQGLVADVDDMYPLMPHRAKNWFDEDSRAHTTINGKSYGLAFPGSLQKNEGLVIRKDWLERLGLKVPTNLDEFFDVCYAFTFKDPDGNGKNDTYGFGAFVEYFDQEQYLGRRFDPIMGAFGVAGTWNMTKDNFGLNVKKPEFYDALQFVNKMVDAKVIDPDWPSLKKDDFRAAWKQGKFGIMREQFAALAAAANYAPFDKNFPNGEWAVIPPPKGPKGKSSVGIYDTNFRIYAVSAKAAKAGKKEAIARLLDYMATDEGYKLIGWGVEGVNYSIDKDGNITDKGVPNDTKFSSPKGQTVTQLRNMVFYNSEMELISRYPYFKTSNGRTMGPLLYLKTMQSMPWTNVTGAGTIRPHPNNADLKRYMNQGVQEFVLGKQALTKENWQAFIVQMDKLGAAEWERAARQQMEEAGYLQ
ncbi:MAG: extracellular solute-binding protein [Spirochaetota bacterium]|nr:extracellular solute-binding protein [Spirochaetota bacterium]HOR92024.1 extracellular solute-binding protein [Rectinema sp.]